MERGPRGRQPLPSFLRLPHLLLSGPSPIPVLPALVLEALGGLGRESRGEAHRRPLPAGQGWPSVCPSRVLYGRSGIIGKKLRGDQKIQGLGLVGSPSNSLPLLKSGEEMAVALWRAEIYGETHVNTHISTQFEAPVMCQSLKERQKGIDFMKR